MGFFEGLGQVLGAMAGKAEQLQQQIDLYRPEYEGMHNNELKEEFERLRPKNTSEARARKMVISQLLRDRGVSI